MLIALFGESCTGKSTLAELLKARIGAQTYSGKDYLRLAKNEAEAQALFRDKLRAAVSGDDLIYVISKPEHLALLPEGAVRVLVTAELDTIQARFAQRMGGQLPPPVAAMLERTHGCFDHQPHSIHVRSGQTDLEKVCRQIETLRQG